MKNKVMIIAELSANHGNSIEIAKQTIIAAKKAGADAVKIQTYTADTLTIKSDQPYFKINNGTLWDGQTLYDLYENAYMPWDWTAPLKQLCDALELQFFSTPFDRTAVDFLDEIGMPYYKVASFEITDIPLIRYIASKGKPMIISTGIATYDEINDAVLACKAEGNHAITLLQCTSQYPAKIEDANIKTMVDMKNAFEVNVGVSDHTEGFMVPITATAMGAVMIEKHFILNKEIGGPDASFSMTPDKFEEMVNRVRSVEKIMGDVSYALTEKKQNSRKFSRSLFIVKDVEAGDKVSTDNVRSIRPGDGLKPKYFPEIMGKTFIKSFIKGTPVSKEMFK